MEILNLSASALFDALVRNNLDRELLLEGTDLQLNDLMDVKKKHSWQDFLKMYTNVALLLGPEKAAREIAYSGIFNDDLSTLRKIGTGLLNVKTIYWYLATIACRYLYKGAVLFTYKKIKTNVVQMEVIISPEIEDCPLLLETYTYLFENIPLGLGLPKAQVTTEIYSRRGVYKVKFSKTSYIFSYFARFKSEMSGYSKAIEFMDELENNSLQLSQTVEVKSEMLRVMSHDMKNSVAIIELALSKVVKRNNLSEEDLKLVNMARKASEQINTILKNVQNTEVDYIKGIKLQSVDIDEVFQVIDDNFRDKYAMKNIGLIIKNELPVYENVLADKSTLELHVLPNLLNNAYKFSEQGTFVTLRATLEDNQVVISVEDQGCGIGNANIDDLFTKKIRTSTTGTAGERGTGLGLGIVRTYVQLYGGRLNVKSNFPAGTVFKIYLQKAMPQNLLTINNVDKNHTHLTH